MEYSNPAFLNVTFIVLTSMFYFYFLMNETGNTFIELYGFQKHCNRNCHSIFLSWPGLIHALANRNYDIGIGFQYLSVKRFHRDKASS